MNRKRYLYVALCLLLVGIGIFIWVQRTMPLARTDFDSFEEFRETGARGYLDLPAGAKDVKYYLDFPVVFMHSMYSFTLKEDAEYNAYMEKIKDYSCTETEASYPAWKRYGEYKYTESELAEMRFVSENYKNMRYSDTLEMCKHNKGFANGYGASVEDYIGLEWLYSVDNFPEHLPFSKIIPDSITDYTILYYRPVGLGTVSTGILVNEETRRFVVYYRGGLR